MSILDILRGQERSEAQFFSFSLATCAVRLTGLVDLVGSEDWEGYVVLWVVKVTASGYCLVIGRLV